MRTAALFLTRIAPLLLLILSGCSVGEFLTKPRNLAVNVDHRRGDPTIGVRVRGVGPENGLSAADFAGYLAAERACRVARKESNDFFALRSFEQESYGSRYVAESGTTTNVYRGDGAVVGQTSTPDTYGTQVLGRADLDAEMLTIAEALDPEGVRNQMQIVAERGCEPVEFKPFTSPGGSAMFMDMARGQYAIHVEGHPGTSERDAGLAAKRGACEIALQWPDEPYMVVEHFSMVTRGDHGRSLILVRTGNDQTRAMFERLETIIDARTCEVINPDIDPLRSE